MDLADGRRLGRSSSTASSTSSQCCFAALHHCLLFGGAEAFFHWRHPLPRAAPQSRERKHCETWVLVSLLQLKFHQPHLQRKQSGCLLAGGLSFLPAAGVKPSPPAFFPCLGISGALDPWWQSKAAAAATSSGAVRERSGRFSLFRALARQRRMLSWAVRVSSSAMVMNETRRGIAQHRHPTGC